MITDYVHKGRGGSVKWLHDYKGEGGHCEKIRIWAEPPLENDEFLEKFILTHIELAIHCVKIVY